MGGATTTTITNAIAKVVDGVLTLTKDGNNTSFMSEYQPETEMSGGDESYRWNVNYSGNTSTESFSEGDAYGTFGNELVAQASIAYTGGYKRTQWSITGHARDAIRGANYYDAMMVEGQQAAAEHMKAQDAALISSAEASVDSTGSYGGLLRSTYNMASYEAAAGGALALSDMRTAYTTLISAPIEADLSSMKIFGEAAVLGEYGDVAVGTTSRPVQTVSSDSAIDAGTLRYNNFYEGIPMKQVFGMTAGTLLWMPKNSTKIIMRRAPQTRDVNLNQDADGFAITSAYIFVNTNPRVCAKITD